MKKHKKSRAEYENLALEILDTIDDGYLDEALLLHRGAVDLPRRAGSPKLFMKRFSALAACLLLVAVLLPLAFVISVTFGGGAKGDAEFAPMIPDNESSNQANGGSISVGESATTFCGELKYLSLEDGRVTLSVRLYDGGGVNYSLSDSSEAGYYATNYLTGDDIGGVYVDGGVGLSYGEPDPDGYVGVVLDLTPFIEKTGSDLSELVLNIFGFGRIDLNP